MKVADQHQILQTFNIYDKEKLAKFITRIKDMPLTFISNFEKKNSTSQSELR